MKKISKLIPLGLCVFLILGSLAGCGSDSPAGTGTEGLGLLSGDTLSVGMNIAYPPFEQWDTDGTPIGLDIDLANAVAEILGVEARFVNTPWGNLFDGLDAGQYDCVISAVTATPERAEQMEFSAPYCDNWQVITIRAGFPPINGLEGLNGLTVGYLDGSTSAQILNDLREQGALTCTIAKYGQMLDGFDDLRLGFIDAVLCDSTLAEGYMKREQGVFEITWTQASEEGAEAERLAIAAKKGNTNLINAINNALKQLEDSGQLDEIRKKWLFNS
jgi:polar amino acid transport system substrate-binding protein